MDRSTLELWQAARGANLRGALAKKRELEAVLRKYGHPGGMTEWDIERTQAAIAEETARVTALVVPLAHAKFDNLIDDYKTLKRKEQDELGKERLRWKPERLQMERDGANMAIGRATSAAEVEKYYRDAVDSGEIHAIKAAAEMAAGAMRKFTEPGSPDRFLANRLSKEAARKLAELQLTPALAEIETRGAEVAQKLVGVVDEIRTVAGEIEPAAGRELVKALAQVSITPHGDPLTLGLSYSVELVPAPDVGDDQGWSPAAVAAMTQGG